MTDTGQQPMADMSQVNKILSERGLAHGRLQRDLVRPQIFMPAFPPVRLLFHDVAEFRLGYLATFARRNEYFAATN